MSQTQSAPGPAIVPTNDPNISSNTSAPTMTNNGSQGTSPTQPSSELDDSMDPPRHRTQQGLMSTGDSGNATNKTVPGVARQVSPGSGAIPRKRKASDDIAPPATRFQPQDAPHLMSRSTPSSRVNETRTTTAQEAILETQAARARAHAADRARQTEQSRRPLTPAERRMAHIDFFDEETGGVLEVVQDFLPPGGIRPPTRMVSTTAYEALTGQSLLDPFVNAGENEDPATPTAVPGYSMTSRPDLAVHRQPAGPVQQGFNPSDDFQTSMRLADANARVGQNVLDDSEGEDVLDDNILDDGPFPWPATYYAREGGR